MLSYRNQGDIMAKSKAKPKLVAKPVLMKGFFYLGAGVIVFLLRYIPIIKINAVFMTSYSSISQVSGSILCNNPLAVADICSWVKPLDIFLIVASIVLVLYGFLILFRSSKK